ncbi:MAG: hypothetical protein J3Q66DRAFT_329881, partial [Benniella sp.]
MQALELPEILKHIGKFLNYPRLAAATAVCKSWNTIFTPLLYHTLEWCYLTPRPRSRVVKGHVDHIRVIKVSTNWIPVLERCRHLEELHLNIDFTKRRLDLDFGGSHDTDSSWKPLADLVRQNPRLVTVCVTKPSNDFLRAVLTCCPQLKRLEIKGADTYTVVLDLELLFNVCLRLEVFKIVDITLDVKGYDDASWINWPAFPTIKNLWIGITQDIHQSPFQMQQQRKFIQRCPNLESWTLSFCERSFRLDEVMEVLSPETSPCPNIKAFAFQFRGQPSGLLESQLVEVVNGCKNLTSFGTTDIRFENLPAQALIDSLASTLTRLSFHDRTVITSVAMMKILSSCPHLIHVYCGGLLDAREILGIQRDKSEREQFQDEKSNLGWGMTTRQLPKRQSLPVPLHPPEWVCKNLQTLAIGICGLEGREPEWQQAVLKQLAKLTQLRVLDVGATYQVRGMVSRDGLDFRLAAGLDILSSLAMLETLCFGCLWQEIGEQEIDWMVKAWPRFSTIDGWMHHSESRRLELQKVFKQHGITAQSFLLFEDWRD